MNRSAKKKKRNARQDMKSAVGVVTEVVTIETSGGHRVHQEMEGEIIVVEVMIIEIQEEMMIIEGMVAARDMVEAVVEEQEMIEEDER